MNAGALRRLRRRENEHHPDPAFRFEGVRLLTPELLSTKSNLTRSLIQTGKDKCGAFRCLLVCVVVLLKL